MYRMEKESKRMERYTVRREREIKRMLEGMRRTTDIVRTLQVK